MANPLIPLMSLSFPRTQRDAINTHAKATFGHGSGPQRKNTVVGSVVAFVVATFATKTTTYPPSTTLQRQNRHPSYVCTCARACVRYTLFFRCGVVLYLYLIENKEEKATTKPTTQGFLCVVAVVALLWMAAKSLESNKILEIYCDAR